jgi:hypothetical protein
MNTPSHLSMSTLKADAGPRSLDSLLTAVDTLRHLQGLQLPWALLAPLSARYLRRIHVRVMGESLTHLRRHPDSRRYALVTLFCYGQMRDLTDRLIELLLQNVHKMSVKAEKRVDRELLADFKRVTGKTRLLFQMAAVSLAHPAEPVQEVIYPVVGVQTLRDLVTEGAATGHFYRDQVHKVMRGSYGHHYRRLLAPILDALTFRSNNDLHQPVIEALALLQQYAVPATLPRVTASFSLGLLLAHYAAGDTPDGRARDHPHPPCRRPHGGSHRAGDDPAVSCAPSCHLGCGADRWRPCADAGRGVAGLQRRALPGWMARVPPPCAGGAAATEVVMPPLT